VFNLAIALERALPTNTDPAGDAGLLNALRHGDKEGCVRIPHHI
jgi:hypothetical protein